VEISGICDEFSVGPGAFWEASPASQALLKRLRERASPSA